MRFAVCFIFTFCLAVAPSKAQTADNTKKIERALSAAPSTVAEHATVMNWDSRSVLKEGTNDYICFPSFGGMPSPMCVGQEWIDFIDAMVNGTEPLLPDRVAIRYWLQGVSPMSNENPFATPEEAANHVIAPGDPHLAILFSDKAMFEGYPDHPEKGGPWVMFKNTPYMHLMVPAPAPSPAEGQVLSQ